MSFLKGESCSLNIFLQSSCIKNNPNFCTFMLFGGGKVISGTVGTVSYCDALCNITMPQEVSHHMSKC